MLLQKLYQSCCRANVRYSSSAYRYHQILREEKRDFDLDYGNEGEVLVEPPLPKLTEVEHSHDPVEWACVENILPSSTVPTPPTHASYPTPSGWVPTTANLDREPYYVKRTRFHNFPIYHQILNGGNRHMTLLKYIQGNIWAMEADLRVFLEKETQKKVYTQVDEVCCKIRVRGTLLEECNKFMLEKGF